MMKKLFLIFIALPLLGQDAPAPKPIDEWSNSLGAGFAMTSGNSDTTNINLTASTAWDPKTDRVFKVEALYLVGEKDGVKHVDKSTALARYERLFQDRAIWFGEVQYLRDRFKAINSLISPVIGAGYHVLRSDARKLTLDGAVGSAFEDNDVAGSKTSGAVKAGQTFEWTITPSSKVTQKLTGLWKTDDFDDALYHFDAGVATTVAPPLELKLSYVYDYKNKPPSAEIEKGDSSLFAALVVKF